MTPERWREVEQVYQSTMDREPRLRAAFLADACGNDEELRREVDSLLELNQSPALVDEPAWHAVAELLTDSTQLAPGAQLGPYRIEALLGAGGMGRVYQSHDTRLGRTVALKVSRVEFNARFEREARAVAALNHPNVCTIHDVGSNYLVMELVEGPTLADRIKEGTLPLEEALRIARQIADALEAAHEKGIVHRDLKPGNIKIKPDGTVKVLDFGLAKLRPIDVAPGTKPEDSPTISMAATSAGMILGTAAYMSPEQARGKAVDKRADIWAFGVVLYEMVAGRQLFEGEDVTETLALVIKGEPKWDGIPASVQRLLKSCLEKDPKRRLRDIGDVWRQLEEAPAATIPSRSRVGIAGWIVAAIAAVLAFVNFKEKPASAEVVRFSIPLPPQKNLTFAAPYLSPDGRHVAFLSENAEGRTQLWVRSLDSLESRPLAGTEDAITSAFWSPDSRSLGFVAQGKLKKVNVSGGSPQTVCDFPVGAAEGPMGNFRSGAWNSDGVILFGTAHTGLWRVSAGGGPLTEVTRLDPSRKEGFHGGPWFLPGGRQFLYDRIGLNPEYNGTYLGSLDAKPEQQSTRRFLTNAFGLVYVPTVGQGSGDGHLLFTREGSLMAQAFDLRRMEPAGEAVSLAQDMISLGRGPGPRPFSASMTGALAYRTGGSAGNDFTITQLSWFDRTGKMLATARDRGHYNSVDLSPDGTRVAVSRVTPETAGRSRYAAYEIWIYDFARGTSTLLTSTASDRLATWSPDGRRIIYSSDRGGSVLNLYRKAADGAASEDLVFSSNEDKSVQDWSRDGKFLLYSVATEGRRSFFPTASHDLWVLPLTPVNPSGSQPEPYLKTESNETQGRFSPDNRFVAYASNESGRYEIYVQPFPRASDGKKTISTAGGISPRWSGDGKELFYISPDSKMMAVEVFKAGIPRPLFQAPIWGGGTFDNVTRYDVTADGKRFLVNSVTADAATSAPAPITIVLNWTALLKK
jgi:serine/threonine protein kinase